MSDEFGSSRIANADAGQASHGQVGRPGPAAIDRDGHQTDWPEQWPGGDEWTSLLAAAAAALKHAYVPYSHYPVGAAAQVDDGRIVTGCNVENASYGLTLCAECGLISALHLSGGGHVTAFVCLNGHGEVITPCGRCRQLLWEHGGPSLRILSPDGEVTLADLLPQAWGFGE